MNSLRVVHRHLLRVDLQEHQHARGGGHRHQVLGRVERHLRVQVRIDRHRAARAHEQRVAVGRLLGHEVAGDVAVGAGAVLHHHRLAQRLRQRLRHGARDLVGGAAGREAHDHADRLGREGLRQRRRRAGAAASGRGQQARRARQSRVLSSWCLLGCCRGSMRGLSGLQLGRHRPGRAACAPSGSARPSPGRGGAPCCTSVGVQRLAGVVGQRRFARRARSPAAASAATPPWARWSSTCSRFSLPRSLVEP